MVVLIQDCISFTVIAILILVVKDGSPHSGLCFFFYDCNFNSGCPQHKTTVMVRG